MYAVNVECCCFPSVNHTWGEIKWVYLVVGHRGKSSFPPIALIGFRRQFSLNINLAKIMHMFCRISSRWSIASSPIGKKDSQFQVDKNGFWPIVNNNIGQNFNCMYASESLYRNVVLFHLLLHITWVLFNTIGESLTLQRFFFSYSLG